MCRDFRSNSEQVPFFLYAKDKILSTLNKSFDSEYVHRYKVSVTELSGLA